MLAANSYRNPVVKVCLLVAMVERVMVLLEPVVIDVHLVGVEVSSHLGISIHILQFWVVMEWNGGEWVEAIWVNCLVIVLHFKIILKLVKLSLLA